METPVDQIRTLCLGLGDVEERISHGEPTWFHRKGRSFAMFADHHHDERVAVWCAAPPGAQQILIDEDSSRFFRPSYVGAGGWVGIYLDVDQDWDEIAAILAEAFAATKRKGSSGRREELQC